MRRVVIPLGDRSTADTLALIVARGVVARHLLMRQIVTGIG
jgi:hypothetical protein